MTTTDTSLKKQLSLYVVECGQFFIGGAISINALLALLIEEGNNPFVYSAILLLGAAFIVSAILLAVDSYASRISAMVCFSGLIFFTLFLIKKPSYWIVLLLITAVVFYVMYISNTNRQYYDSLRRERI